MHIKQKNLPPVDFDGLKIFDYTAGKETNSSFAEIIVPPGASHRVSWSKRSDKYYYVIEGALSLTVDGIEFDMEAGDFCIIHKGSKFSYINRGNKESRLMLVHTPGFKLECEEFEDQA